MRLFKCASICLGMAALLASAYVVKEGDTLWDLSDEYLKDPFAWPDLWENNRHIKDPHWIYPGDSIYINESVPHEREAVLQMDPSRKKFPCDAAVADSNLPKGITAAGCDDDTRGDEFESMLGDLRSKDKKGPKKKREDDKYNYTQRSAPKTFNGYYQALAPEIYVLDSLKNDSNFVSIRSAEKKQPIIHLPEHEVLVGLGKKTHENLKKGDLIEILDAKAVDVPTAQGSGFEKFAMLRLSGIAKITAIGDTLSRAQIVQSFREIKIQQSKARVKMPLNALDVSGYTPEKAVMMDSLAMIRYAMDPMLIIGAYSYVLIDKGSQQGYATGDAIAIWEEDKSDATIPPHLLGRGIIARAADNEAAVLIREVYSSNRRIETGNRVSITHHANIVQ